ncbi:MAG: response regulator [Deltaproteobacteria bacterium]|nr:response regulator [Deltaproteobacteria bacterium]
MVDDNEVLLRAWSRLLENHRCDCYTTTDPQTALDLIELEKVQVLITDIVMPEMDGFELIRKAEQLNPDIRIILTTGYPCDFSRIRLNMDTPNIHVLLKPYNDIREIRKFVDRVIEDDDTLDTEDSFKNPDDIQIHLWNL